MNSFGIPHCPHDGNAMQFVQDLTEDPDAPEQAFACPCCDRLYWVTQRHLVTSYQCAGYWDLNNPPDRQ